MTPILQLLAKWLKPLILASILVAVITAIIVPRLPRGVDVSTSLTVPVPERPVSDNYEYDGYYALQSTDLFSNTLTGWFKSSNFVSSVLERAGIKSAPSIRSLGHFFTTRKVSGQLVEVQFHAKTKQEGQKIVKAFSSVLAEQIASFNEEGNKTLSFNVIVGEPLYAEVARNAILRALVAGFVTFVVGINLVIFIDVFKGLDK